MTEVSTHIVEAATVFWSMIVVGFTYLFVHFWITKKK